MRNAAKPLKIHPFGNDPLSNLGDSRQIAYLRCYLSDLGAVSALEEPNYFDRDYLAEFSAFYSRSSKGYPNVCRRLHFFHIHITRQLIRRAAGGSHRSQEKLQSSYLGFVVLRPIPNAPLGRTVLQWYPDEYPDTPRISTPSRMYHCHVAGIELQVEGLAWQQQDMGVSACATVGLWTMLHSSAFDDHHAIPTTVDITRSAHQTASLGGRVFPSAGLTSFQICEAVKEHKLAPIVFDGDQIDQHTNERYFSRERFLATCASLIRSGYPVLVTGTLGDIGGHAICVVGFRSPRPKPVVAGEVELQDGDVPYIYVHDDNIGPSVRLSIDNKGVLSLSPPPERRPRPIPLANDYKDFVPRSILVAVHEDVRTSPDRLHHKGIDIAYALSKMLEMHLNQKKLQAFGLSLSTRLMKLSDYLGAELAESLAEDPRLLAKVRMDLTERVAPMSLHIGIIRIGLPDSTPLLDVLYDTTDSDKNHPVFAHICYYSIAKAMLTALKKVRHFETGYLVEAYL